MLNGHFLVSLVIELPSASPSSVSSSLIGDSSTKICIYPLTMTKQRTHPREVRTVMFQLLKYGIDSLLSVSFSNAILGATFIFMHVSLI